LGEVLLCNKVILSIGRKTLETSTKDRHKAKDFSTFDFESYEPQVDIFEVILFIVNKAKEEDNAANSF
jgi:hypothetical protein